MLQTTQLPRPEPIRLIETKTAKTLANNNRKIANYHHEETSSKDGSLTEDSGVGSQTGGGMDLERLNYSPTYGAKRSRNLEMVITGNKFDVHETEETPLPQLPSAFSSNSDKSVRGYHNVGFVRDMALDYQRHREIDNRRKISITSSEGFSDDYGEEEKTLRDRYKTEKPFTKYPSKSFLKVRSEQIKDTDSSTPSSDEQDWVHGGEAMADEVSFSISSSDESRDKEASISITMTSNPVQNELRDVVLAIDDPKFAALVASTGNASLLDDETSPIESLISFSESDEILKKKIDRSSSNSKDINEKLTPPSPGTPTNASLSISDGKDDFLIDDEIADQPALVFEDTMCNNESYNMSQNNSESTHTIVDSTPKPKRRSFLTYENSPLSARKKKQAFNSRGSLDTLSPCESIASDDLMMDYDYSQSSGLDDIDK